MLRWIAATAGWCAAAVTSSPAAPAGRLRGMAVLFEIVVGLGGERNLAASRYVLAVLLIVAGLVLLGRRLLAARRP